MAPEVNAAGRMRITDALTAICIRSIANGDSQGARAAGGKTPGGGDAGLNRVRYRYRLLTLISLSVPAAQIIRPSYFRIANCTQHL